MHFSELLVKNVASGMVSRLPTGPRAKKVKKERVSLPIWIRPFLARSLLPDF